MYTFVRNQVHISIVRERFYQKHSLFVRYLISSRNNSTDGYPFLHWYATLFIWSRPIHPANDLFPRVTPVTANSTAFQLSSHRPKLNSENRQHDHKPNTSHLYDSSRGMKMSFVRRRKSLFCSPSKAHIFFLNEVGCFLIYILVFESVLMVLMNWPCLPISLPTCSCGMTNWNSSTIFWSPDMELPPAGVCGDGDIAPSLHPLPLSLEPCEEKMPKMTIS